MERRIAFLLFLAALCAGTAAVLQSDDKDTKHAQQPGKTVTDTSTVLGDTVTSTVTIPGKPAKQPPRLPGKGQHPPGTTPPPAGDLGTQSDAVARQQLESFLATRPELVPYEDSIWYSAHYSYSNVTPKGLAGLVWCIGFRIAACDRAGDAAQR
ncbi:MAG: hypothetical protein QOH73_566 [Gaiellaceae bacterium]|nr:hypothetical protein [Gaiellaceae bacterium]